MYKLNVDSDDVVRLTQQVLRQLPYAANNAITRTAKEAIDAGQKEVAADLQLRKRFILNRIRILQYSRVSNLTAIIGVDDKVQGSPLILGFLEDGGSKEPQHGGSLAIPLTGSPARSSFPASVPTALKYKNLDFENRRGRKRTFVIPDVGIFERVAAGDSPDATVLIYSFKPSAPIRKEINLREVLIQVIGERFAPIFSEEFEKEILKRARR